MFRRTVTVIRHQIICLIIVISHFLPLPCGAVTTVPRQGVNLKLKLTNEYIIIHKLIHSIKRLSSFVLALSSCEARKAITKWNLANSGIRSRYLLLTRQTRYPLRQEAGWSRRQKQKYRGMFETQKSRNKTSSGDIGLNIRTLASPKVGQDQVSGGVSVLCWHAAPVANVLWKPLAIR